MPIKRDVLYIANHVSWLDILVLAGKTGSAFVAKADMAPWPVIGWLATLNNSVYVAREQRLDVHAQALAMKTALETSQPLSSVPRRHDGRWTRTFALPVVARRIGHASATGHINPACRHRLWRMRWRNRVGRG